MKLLSLLRRGAELGVAFIAIFTLILAGCGGGGGGGSSTSSSGGGGGGSSSSAPTTSVTVTPFKGPYSAGAAVILRDATGAQVASGVVGTNGTATLTFSTSVNYPLLVEVSGQYWNEVTNVLETSTVPLRGLIATAAETNVPVTLITEAAVADLEKRIGASWNATHAPITAASAVAALSAMSLNFNIPASAVPVFDVTTHTTTDSNTAQLAALAVVANNKPGATLMEKVQALASEVAALPPASSVAAVIPQASMVAAVSTVQASVAASGVTVSVPVISSAPVQTNQATASQTAQQQVNAVTSGATAYAAFLADAKAGDLRTWLASQSFAGSGVTTTFGQAAQKKLIATVTANTYTASFVGYYLQGNAWVKASPLAASGTIAPNFFLTSTGWVSYDPASPTVEDKGAALQYPTYSVSVVAKTDLGGQAVTCVDPMGSDPVGASLYAGPGIVSGVVASASCAVATNYPLGSTLYTLRTSHPDGYYLSGASFLQVTDGQGIPLTSFPVVGSRFCVSETYSMGANTSTFANVYEPIANAPTGADNYSLHPAQSCGAADITAALTNPAPQTTRIELKATGMAGVTVLQEQSSGMAQQGAAWILAYHQGQWRSGAFTSASTTIVYSANKLAANAQLQAHGLPILP